MDLQFVLSHLGVTCYWPRLFEAGFETWEILKDITEKDMNGILSWLHYVTTCLIADVRLYREATGMKLAHRRVRSSLSWTKFSS